MTTNEDRAAWARAAVQTFADRTRHSYQGRDLDNPDNLNEVLGDLLGDLRHLVGAEQYELCCIRGSNYYQEELAEEAAEVRRA